MRPELENIYEGLYDNYPDRNRYPYGEQFQFIRTIQKEIDYHSRRLAETDNKRGIILRSDAKLFLLVVFFEIIVVPISSVQERPDAASFQRDIRNDIATIIAACMEPERSSNESTEITAHTVLTVVDDIWGSLNISSVKLWNS